jgi:2,3-bisphosphoglycerate-dependent phosphoglycerate mutase
MRFVARVLLIRHCQTTGQGVDSPLTELGREQAIALAVWLQGRGVDRIVSSPFQRAIDTIAPFAVAAGLEVEVDERMAERNLGGGSYETVAELHEAVRAAMDDRELRHPGGETGLEIVARGWPALLEALDGPNLVTALVAHGQMNLHLLREIDPSFGFDAWRAMTTPDVFEIWRNGDGVIQCQRLWERQA